MSAIIHGTGNLGEPRQGTTNNGKPYLNLSIGTTPRRKNQYGEWENDGDPVWINATLWGDEAVNAAGMFQKGAPVIFTGTLKQRSYQGQNGEQRTALELKSARVALAPRRNNDNNGFGGPAQQDQGQWGGPQNGSDQDPWATGNTQPQPQQQQAPAQQQQQAQPQQQQAAPQWSQPAAAFDNNNPPF